MRRRTPATVVAIAAVSVALALQWPTPSGAVGTGGWTSYLHDSLHSSFNPNATKITPANAGSLIPAWPAAVFPDPPFKPGQPPATWAASPTVYNRRIYIGSNSGVFYAYNLTTGALVWRKLLGFQSAFTCSGQGIVSTATVAIDPVTQKAVVYVAAGDGYLYALRPATGGVLWRTKSVDPGVNVNAAFPWASPLVLNGRVYLGMSSTCDDPLIRGGLQEFDQNTGALLQTYYSVPEESLGGSIWSSPAGTSDGSSVFVSTGNADEQNMTPPGDSYSIVRIDGTTLTKQDIWTVPDAQLVHDSDFGGSPTIFKATIDGNPTQLVGACNKNGKYYALDTSNMAAGPVWAYQVSFPFIPGQQNGLCLAAATFDGSRLFVSGSKTTIEGVDYPGSIRQLDPATGVPVWETGLDGQIWGSPSMNGSGVIAAPTYNFVDPNSVILLDASNGNILGKVSVGSSQIFSQPVFNGRYLVVATKNGGMIAYTTP
jgi:outer membrane protein assembly factor BamB